MSSQKIQGELWGKRPKDWASIQEATSKAGYEYALQLLKIKPTETLLDVGCGSGIFCDLALKKGAKVTGVDASEQLIEEAKKRNSSISFHPGEMEDLSFEDNSFDIVCAFNSFQYASDVTNALSEAKRVLKEKGKLIVMIWGNKEDCEFATFMKAVRDFFPPPPPVTHGPFTLSENRLLEKTIEKIGLRIIDNTDVTSIWNYPSVDIALKGIMSAGPAARTIETIGFEKVYEAMNMVIGPFIQQNKGVVFNNKLRVVTSVK
jgi:ubiquinone/menaquinone biosynthesis C-methylase UbiE